jgi:D-alanine-D-alanine ligase
VNTEKASAGPSAVVFRYEPTDSDRQRVREIVDSSGFFHREEVDVAVELVDERLARGPASGYHFVFAEIDGRTWGYACYGHIAVTRASFDLYWIAVDKNYQGKGLGRILLDESERLIQAAGGRRVYIETSNRELYQPTRGFYDRCGYQLEAILKEFYGPGDDKAIYVKAL